MKLCPVCQRCYDDADSVCASDQTALVAARSGPRLVAGKYSLDRLLGRGGMGAVYAGTHLDLDRPVAIKLLLSDFTADADALERFRREARAAARLNHPNIADTFDYGVLPEGGAYIVMELVEGQTLREYMDVSGAMPLAEAAEIGRQVASGMEAAHRAGIIHRDLKPSNIILARDHDGHLQAKVVDFGVAKLKEYSTTGGLTSSGSLIGTPRYMSPEQCAGHTTDARSDIYSMGVILYEMLAGRPPFDAPSATAVAIKHIQQPPPSIKDVRADAPPELNTFLCQVLDKDPEKRPHSAAEFAKELTAAIGAAAAPATFDPPPPAREILRGSAGARDTGSSSAERIQTHRTGGPTIEHAAAQDSHDDPSVRAFAMPNEAVADPGTTPAAQAPEMKETRESVPVVDADPVEPAAPETVRRQAQAPSNAPSKKPVIIVGAAVFLLGFILVAVWLTRSKPQPAPAEAKPTPAPVNSQQDAAKEPPQDARAELRTALEQWVAATNSRDIDRLMAFYDQTLSVFYQRRGATQAAVRAEKNRLLAVASRIEVRASDPEIDFGADGQTATMRFHKSWDFAGASPASGEVIQELRWRKTTAGWKINAERDAQVIRVSK